MSPNSEKGELVKLIHKQALFTDLDEKSLVELGRGSHLRQLPKGSVLFFQEDPADSLYVVCHGSVLILLTSPDGRELVIGEMQPGDYFGELALITGNPRSTTAITCTRCELLVIPGGSFLSVLERHPALTRRLLDLTAQRLYESSQRESALAFLDAPARLARTLLQLDHSAQASGYITISQEELARRTGLTRQTAAKFLGRWRRQGWLITGRGRIVLLNQSALRKVEGQGFG